MNFKACALIFVSLVFSQLAFGKPLTRDELGELRKLIAYSLSNKCLDGKAIQKADKFLNRIDEKSLGDYTSDEMVRLVKVRALVNKGKIRGTLGGQDCTKDYQKAVNHLDKILAPPESKPGASDTETTGTQAPHSPAAK